MTGVEAAAISAVVSGMLKIVANKLAPLLIKEYNSIVGVKEDLQELHDLVEEIKFLLETTADNSNGNRQSFAWLKKLKDITLEVDDVVDEFQLKSEKHDSYGDGGIMSRYMCTIPKSFVFQCKAANKINAIKKRFAAIVKQRTDYIAITNSLLVDHPIWCTNMRPKEVSSLSNVDEASVVGRDKDKLKIVSMLEENDDQLKIKIVSIIGLGGSGKTTLAKLVFNDGDIIVKHFEVRLWVHVSQNFDVKDLIKKVFEAFSENNPGPHALPYMTKTISDNLKGKRFLLVLDDVWTDSRDEWEEFMVYIKVGAPKSRILLTTRNREIAVAVGSTDQFHLPFLSPDDSWQLFQQSMVTPPIGWNTFKFEEVGKEIVDKCGGVPLAIKVLAGALHGKERIEEWEAVRDKNLSNVNGKEDIIASCLRLSYFHLPSNLKQCFTICSIFPKGHRIDKEQLIDLWIAHDLITLDDGSDYLNLEYIGHKHFNSLLEVSFLQNVKDKYGRLTCGMHDLVHDLAISIMGDEISFDVPHVATSSTKTYRYFSLIKRPENMVPKNIFRKARAVYMHPYTDYTYVMALKHANHLRSVTAGYVDGEEANTISQVKYLKYLSMSLRDGETLPKGISNLWSLQSLHVTESNSLVVIPESIGKLKMLRTLNFSGCKHLEILPDSIGDCQMISRIDLCHCYSITRLPESIGRNKKLRVLRLCKTNIERLPLGIIALRNLECLDLQGCHVLELPEGISKMENLQVLNLKDCEELGGMSIGIGLLSRLQKLGLFVVGKGEKFAGISELANVSRIGEELTIRGITHVIEPNDAHMACLKQKENLQRLHLQWMAHLEKDVEGVDETLFHYVKKNYVEEVNTEIQRDVLDGLEPPPGIKELEIDGYSGRQYARWMQNQVDSGVQGPSPFPFLRVMRLCHFPNLKHLHGLVELPCLEELELSWMSSLESISGGPFPSLVRMEMVGLDCLGEVWMVAERTMPDEEGGCCYIFTPQLGQVVQVGNCLTELKILYCPKLEIKPHLPLWLQQLELTESEQVLQSLGQSQGSSSPPYFNQVKTLEQDVVTGLGSGHGWEQLGELCSLQELTIKSCPSLSGLPQSIGQLTSLQLLVIESCNALNQLPECLGELCSLRKLKIEDLPELTCLPESICHLTTLPQGIEGLGSLEKLSIWKGEDLTSLPQGIKGLVSLEELWVSSCPGIQSLPKGIKGLTALKKLWIFDCPDLDKRCERGKGEDWHLISHIPDVVV